jgi:transposase
VFTSYPSGFIEEKTATYNRLRGLISEFGVIAPQSADALRHMVSVQKSLYRFRFSNVLMI